LSQKNTIPNASAVVFRRPERLDFSGELEKLRFAGDWLFYALLIKSGKISFLPEVLNVYRRHEATVSHRSVREDTQANESLSVKASVFESYPVSPGAISASLARSVFEYSQLTERMELNRPALTANPHLVAPLKRIQTTLEHRLNQPRALRVLLLLGDLKTTAETLAVIDLANALAREHVVFLCNAQPRLFDEALLERMDPRLILLEGTLGVSAWSLEAECAGGAGASHVNRRALVIKELLRLLRIDVVHSRSLPAHRLMLEVIGDVQVPWLIHAKGIIPERSRQKPEPESFTLASEIVSASRGVFYEHDDDLELLERAAVPGVAGKPRWILDSRLPTDRIAAACAEVYREVCNRLAFPSATEPAHFLGDEYLAPARRRPA
jgi:hypothetical protein